MDFNKRIYDIESRKKMIGQAPDVVKRHLGESKSQSRLVTDISTQYEKSQLKKHYIKLT